MSEKTETNAAAADEAAKDPFEGFITEAPHDAAEDAAAPDKEQDASKEAEKAESAPDKEQADGEKKSSKKTVDDRIAEITAKRRQAERDADASAKRVAELEERLAALEGGKKDARDQLTQGNEAAKADPDAPDPEKFEYGEVDSRYVAALARYEAKKELAEEKRKNDETRQAEAAAREAQEVRQKLDKQIRKGVEAHDDFEAALEALEAIETPIAAESASLLIESEYGAEMLYHFGKNPAEAAEVASKSPIEQARIIGRLEARFAAEKAGKQDDKKTEAKVSKAPTPPETRARGSNGRFEVPDDTDDFAAFEAKYKNL